MSAKKGEPLVGNIYSKSNLAKAISDIIYSNKIFAVKAENVQQASQDIIASVYPSIKSETPSTGVMLTDRFRITEVENGIIVDFAEAKGKWASIKFCSGPIFWDSVNSAYRFLGYALDPNKEYTLVHWTGLENQTEQIVTGSNGEFVPSFNTGANIADCCAIESEGVTFTYNSSDTFSLTLGAGYRNVNMTGKSISGYIGLYSLVQTDTLNTGDVCKIMFNTDSSANVGTQTDPNVKGNVEDTISYYFYSEFFTRSSTMLPYGLCINLIKGLNRWYCNI